jgi:hypothetical protein
VTADLAASLKASEAEKKKTNEIHSMLTTVSDSLRSHQQDVSATCRNSLGRRGAILTVIPLGAMMLSTLVWCALSWSKSVRVEQCTADRLEEMKFILNGISENAKKSRLPTYQFRGADGAIYEIKNNQIIPSSGRQFVEVQKTR